MEPPRRGPGEDQGPSGRALLVAAILVAVLVAAGLAVSQGLLSMSRLQDCASTGRRDC